MMDDDGWVEEEVCEGRGSTYNLTEGVKNKTFLIVPDVLVSASDWSHESTCTD